MSSSLKQALAAAAQLGGPPLTVAQFNALTRRLIETNLPLLWIAGEVSNFTRPASGHAYFSLKDDRAQVRCVMFRQRLTLLDWVPADGVHVELRAAPSLYEPRGEFQLNVDFMRRAGLGALYERFARLKERLAAEGLFAVERKRALPAFPRRVGVITSTAAATLRDVLTTLRRRMPSIAIFIYPTQVQGEGAAAQIVAALRLAAARRECDALLLVRGGGSIEDLWSFNEESVARAIVASPIPVVSGVGHETDFTIADFVADVRAATPTAAAELVSPRRADWLRRLDALRRQLRTSAIRALERRMQHSDLVGRRLVHPGERLRAQQRVVGDLRRRLASSAQRRLAAGAWPLGRLKERLIAAAPDATALTHDCGELQARLERSLAMSLERHARQLQSLGAQLSHLSPAGVLARGYAIVTRADGLVVRSSRDLAVGADVDLTLAQGSAGARITQTRN